MMADKKPAPGKKGGQNPASRKPKGTKQGPQLSRAKRKQPCPNLRNRGHGSGCPLCHGSGEV